MFCTAASFCVLHVPSPFSLKLFEVLGLFDPQLDSRRICTCLWTTLVAKTCWNLDALSNGFIFAVRPLIRESRWQILFECIPHNLKRSFSQLAIFKSTSTQQRLWLKCLIPWAPTWIVNRHLQSWRACAALVLRAFCQVLCSGYRQIKERLGLWPKEMEFAFKMATEKMMNKWPF